MGLDVGKIISNLVSTDSTKVATQEQGETQTLAGSIFSSGEKKADSTTGSPPQPSTDQNFEAFKAMTEKFTGKKLENLSNDEYKAAMKAFISSKTETKAPAEKTMSTVDQDSDAFKKSAEKTLDNQEVNFMGTHESGYMKKSDYDKLTPEQQKNYIKDLKKALGGEEQSLKKAENTEIKKEPPAYGL